MVVREEQWRQIEKDKELWVPPQVKQPNPVDGTEEPKDRNVAFNVVRNEIEVADESMMEDEINLHGWYREPELGRYQQFHQQAQQAPEGALGSYATTYWTHWDWRSDVAKSVVRMQKQYPWMTYANTYFHHPPVLGRQYEFVSVDYWAGGIVGGRYVGYRGKSLNITVNGWDLFNTIFLDPYLPNIYWIIFNGYMWTRGYGWGPSPGGPPDSDPRHDHHIHVSYLL